MFTGKCRWKGCSVVTAFMSDKNCSHACQLCLGCTKLTSILPADVTLNWGGAASAASGKISRMVSYTGTPTEPTCTATTSLPASA